MVPTSHKAVLGDVVVLSRHESVKSPSEALFSRHLF